MNINLTKIEKYKPTKSPVKYNQSLMNLFTGDKPTNYVASKYVFIPSSLLMGAPATGKMPDSRIVDMINTYELTSTELVPAYRCFWPLNDAGKPRERYQQKLVCLYTADKKRAMFVQEWFINATSALKTQYFETTKVGKTLCVAAVVNEKVISMCCPLINDWDNEEPHCFEPEIIEALYQDITQQKARDKAEKASKDAAFQEAVEKLRDLY